MPGVYQQSPNISQPLRGVIDAPEPFVEFTPHYRVDVWYTPLEITFWRGQNKNKANLSDEIFPIQPRVIPWTVRSYAPYPTLQLRVPYIDNQPAAPVAVFIYAPPTSRVYFNAPDFTTWQKLSKIAISAEDVYFRNIQREDVQFKPFDPIVWNAQNKNKANLSAEIIYFQPVKYPDVFHRGLEWSSWKAQNKNKANLSDEIFPIQPRVIPWTVRSYAPYPILQPRVPYIDNQPAAPVAVFIYAPPTSRVCFNAPDFTTWRRINKFTIPAEDVYFRNIQREDVQFKPFDPIIWNIQNKNKANLSDEIFPPSIKPLAWHLRFALVYPSPQNRKLALDQQPAPVEVFIYESPASRVYFNADDLTAWNAQYKNKSYLSELIVIGEGKISINFVDGGSMILSLVDNGSQSVLLADDGSSNISVVDDGDIDLSTPDSGTLETKP